MISMDTAAKMLCILLPLFAVLSPAVQPALTLSEARRLAVAPMPREAKSHGMTIELDRKQGGCAIYHVYSIGGEAAYFNTATLGWWSVDLRTAEVWNELGSERVTTPEIGRIPRELRKRLGVSDDEVSASIANPCFERYLK